MNQETQIGAYEHPENLPDFIQFSEKRTDRNVGFALNHELQSKGLTYDQAVAVATYSYYLEVPVTDLMNDAEILDAGAQKGDLRSGLIALGSTAKVTNLDYKPNPNIDVVADITHMPMVKDNTFDLVLAKWAIPDDIDEETPSDIMAKEIEELFRVTKKGGKLYFLPIAIHGEGTRDRSNGIAKENYENVIELLERLKSEYPQMNVEIIRHYENMYAKESIGYKKHDKDYVEMLVIQK